MENITREMKRAKQLCYRYNKFYESCADDFEDVRQDIEQKFYAGERFYYYDIKLATESWQQSFVEQLIKHCNQWQTVLHFSNILEDEITDLMDLEYRQIFDLLDKINGEVSVEINNKQFKDLDNKKLLAEFKDRLLSYVNVYHIKITTDTYQKGTINCSFETLYEQQRKNL